MADNRNLRGLYVFKRWWEVVEISIRFVAVMAQESNELLAEKMRRGSTDVGFEDLEFEV